MCAVEADDVSDGLKERKRGEGREREKEAMMYSSSDLSNLQLRERRTTHRPARGRDLW